VNGLAALSAGLLLGSLWIALEGGTVGPVSVLSIAVEGAVIGEWLRRRGWL
jgi:hypothetical protein